jgi:hypothetical protein
MLSTHRRTNWRRDMATFIDTLLQIVIANAPKQMSNAVSTLPKASRISENVHPAIWNYSHDQDIDCVFWVAFLRGEPPGTPRHSVQSVAELATRLTRDRKWRNHFARWFSNTAMHSTCLPHTSYRTPLPPPPRDLPKRYSVISRQQEVPRYVLYQIFN